MSLSNHWVGRGWDRLAAGVGGRRRVLRALCLAFVTLAAPAALAAPSHFDLAGPRLSIVVTRDGTTLPISQTPGLSPGDRIRLRADFPAAQATRYLLVVAFLRGATDPPPKAWFFQSQTWRPSARAGLTVTAPQGAQRVLVFLAPATRGDFATLVGAVRHSPGVFVRAAQDLDRLDRDQTRVDAFLAGVDEADPAQPGLLQARTAKLARSLILNVDPQCFRKAPELQAACVTRNPATLLMDGGGASPSSLRPLSAGAASGLFGQLLSAGSGSAGDYGSYLGSVIGVARIMNTLNTASYQYIPALVRERDDQVALFLDTPPSFGDPKSVLLATLPPIGPAPRPSLEQPPPAGEYCAQEPDLVLPAEGAPLAFSTGYAHGLVLRLTAANGRSADLPARLDAGKGGFVVDTASLQPGDLAGALVGTIHGYWGFTPFAGPRYALVSEAPRTWRADADDLPKLIVGRTVTLHLTSQDAVCAAGVSLRSASETVALAPRLVRPGELAVELPLAAAAPGDLAIQVRQYGGVSDIVRVKTFAPSSDLVRFTLHAGDAAGVLYGRRLGEVSELRLAGVDFKPDEPASTATGGQLSMTAPNAQATAALDPGQAAADVILKDGRTLTVVADVEAPRPSVQLIAKSVTATAPAPLQPIELADPDELPAGATLSFRLRAISPASFSGNETIEVATSEGSAASLLTFRNGLTLVDAHVIQATLDTGAALAASSGFGALRYRLVEAGVAGDWQPLIDLVRLPQGLALACGAAPSQPCTLTGTDLIRIAAISTDPGFDQAVQVPEGFFGDRLTVPRPTAGRLYLKLRDDPSVINQLIVDAPAPNQPPPGAPSHDTAAAAGTAAGSGEKTSS